jgi:hypothetical protein
VALTARLITVGYSSALYAGDPVLLREELNRIRYLLATSGQADDPTDETRIAGLNPAPPFADACPGTFLNARAAGGLVARRWEPPGDRERPTRTTLTRMVEPKKMPGFLSRLEEDPASPESPNPAAGLATITADGASRA